MRSIVLRDNYIRVIDSTELPSREKWIRLRTASDVAGAIRDMRIRGAPLIGVASAFGLAIEAIQYRGDDIEELRAKLKNASRELLASRPTGRNLSWAIDRCLAVIDRQVPLRQAKALLLSEAKKMADEDIRVNLSISQIGSELIDDGDRILTHCNSGGLGTVKYGTALGIIRMAFLKGKRISVIATETRPLLQGARLTAWELKKLGISFKMICDSAAGYVMSKRFVDKVFLGADRVLRTGHTANKVGTLMLAILAKYYEIPFYVAAPLSTFDLATDPEKMPIEERDPREVTSFAGKLITVRDARACNPAFDVTPPGLITGIVTEGGVVRPPYKRNIADLFLIKRSIQGQRRTR